MATVPEYNDDNYSAEAVAKKKGWVKQPSPKAPKSKGFGGTATDASSPAVQRTVEPAAPPPAPTPPAPTRGIDFSAVDTAKNVAGGAAAAGKQYWNWASNLPLTMQPPEKRAFGGVTTDAASTASAPKATQPAISAPVNTPGGESVPDIMNRTNRLGLNAAKFYRDNQQEAQGPNQPEGTPRGFPVFDKAGRVDRNFDQYAGTPDENEQGPALPVYRNTTSSSLTDPENLDIVEGNRRASSEAWSEYERNQGYRNAQEASLRAAQTRENLIYDLKMKMENLAKKRNMITPGEGRYTAWAEELKTIGDALGTAMGNYDYAKQAGDISAQQGTEAIARDRSKQESLESDRRYDLGLSRERNVANANRIHESLGKEQNAINREGNTLEYNRQSRNDFLDSRASLAKVFFGDTNPQDSVSSAVNRYLEGLGSSAKEKYQKDPEFKKEIDSMVSNEIMGRFDSFVKSQMDSMKSQGGNEWRPVKKNTE